MERRSGVLAAFVGVLATGCLTAPPSPVARLTRIGLDDPGESSRGVVGASFGAIYATPDGRDESLLQVPGTEASVTLAPTDRYRVAVISAPVRLGGEGNFVALDSPGFRLGILHGLAFGALVTEDGTTIASHLSGGLLAEFGSGATTGFVGGRYVYSDIRVFSDSAGDSNGDATSIGGSAGLVTGSGRLRLAPELVVAFVEGQSSTGLIRTSSELWVVVPTLTVLGLF